MNYWKLGIKQQRSFSSRLEEWTFRLFDVESQSRSKLDSFLIMANYLLSYIILFFLIMQSIACHFINPKQRPAFTSYQETGQPRLSLEQTTNQDFKIITILLLVRLGLAVLYILFQKIFIIIFIKCLLIVFIFITQRESTQEEFIAIELPLFLLELVVLAVWAYKIQRRILHFDSRLSIKTPFLKDALIFLSAFLIKRIQKMTWSVFVFGEWTGGLNFTIFEIQALQIVAVCLSLIVLLDFSDFLYNRTFKQLLISLDFAFISLLTSWAFSIHLTGKNLPYFNYLALFTTVVGLQFMALFRREQFKILYQIDTNKLGFQSENQLIKYFETIRRLIKSEKLTHTDKNIAIISFIVFHRSTCLYPTCPFTKRYNMQDPIDLKCELIEEYILKSMEKLSVTRPMLKKYLIFYLSPKDKIFRYIDQQQSYMKRQIWRMKQVHKQLNNQIRILEAEVTIKLVTQMIEAYLTFGKRFFEILMKQNINCTNLVAYGQKMIDFLNKVEQIKANSANFTQSVRVLINNFSTRIINDSKSQILETVVDPPYLLHKTTESGPTMIVSAEPQNFLRIIDANIACTKEFYYPKEFFLSLTSIDLLPEQIKVKHREHYDRVSKKTDFDGEKDFPTSLFVTNMNGFMSFFTAVVYLLNSIKGRIWCVSIEITHKMNAIMLVAMEKNGVVMGISEMAVFHGLKTTDKGKQLKEYFYKKLRTKIEGSSKYKCVTVDPYENIFEKSDFYFFETKSFEIVEEFTAFGLSYFLVQIHSVLESQAISKGRSSILRSLISIDNRTSSLSINEEELNFVPKKQLFYHSDGVVRTYSEKPMSIIQRFENFAEKAGDQEEELKEELGKGITEMRLVDEQLDFLENIEQQNEFQSKPKTQIQQKQHELNRFEMKRQFFDDCYEQRKSMIPQWLKYTRVFFVLVIIASIVIMSIDFWYNSTLLDEVQNLQSLLNGISSNLINYIKLSKVLLAAKYFNPSLVSRLKEFYDTSNKEIETSSQKMFSIDPNVEQYFSQQQIDKTLSKYLIAFSDISILGKLDTFNEKNLISDLVYKITPSFNTLLENKINDFEAQNDKVLFNSMLFMIGLGSVAASVWVWVFIVRSKMLQKRQSILLILSKIKDSLLERELVKILLFEQYLYFDHDIFCEDDLNYIMKTNDSKGRQGAELLVSQGIIPGGLKRKFSWKNKKAEREEEAMRISHECKGSEHKILTTNQYSQQPNPKHPSEKQAGVLYIKKLIESQSIKCLCLLTIVWVSAMITFQILFYQTVANFAFASEKIFRIQYNIQRMQSSSDIVWVLLNDFPYNQQILDSYERSMYDAEANFRSGVIAMTQSGQLNRPFLEFYQNIWTQDACSYIEEKVQACRSVLHGALQEGADQIVAFLNRKYDFLVSSSLTPSLFRSKQSIKRIAEIQMNYMTEVVKVNMEKLAEEHDRYADVFERQLFIFLVMSLICLGSLGLVYKILLRENQQLVKLERLLKLIEFDSLKEMNEFKLYFKENYHDKLYK